MSTLMTSDKYPVMAIQVVPSSGRPSMIPLNRSKTSFQLPVSTFHISYPRNVFLHDIFSVQIQLQCRYLTPALNTSSNLGIIHDRTPGCHGLERTLYLCLASLCGSRFIFRHVIQRCLYYQALANVWSTDVGIECLYCSDATFTFKYTDIRIYAFVCCRIFKHNLA